MDQGDGYEAAAVSGRLIPRKPVLPRVSYTRTLRSESSLVESMEDAVDGSELHPSGSQWTRQDSSQTTLTTGASYPYYPYETVINTESSDPFIRTDLRQQTASRVPDSPPPEKEAMGTVIKPVWKRHLLTWALAFLAVCLFVFTAYFAWNATGGDHANTRLLFSDPGRTILILQILTNITTTLFGELVVASCEMVFR
jgi:hypothetical protein